MTIRLYLDEDSLDWDLVRALRARGVDVITALEAAMIDRDDDDHLAYATVLGRVLYSFNRSDYYRLHALWLRQERSHTGIVLARQQHYSVGEQMRRLLKLISTRSAEEMNNQVEFLNRWGD